jgi:tetratricopeptide (TPR) repeat protein
MKLNQMRLIVFRSTDRMASAFNRLRMRHSLYLSLLPLAVVPLPAQEPLNPPVPLIALSPAPSPGDQALSLAAAQRAQEMGFPSTAAVLYRQLLAATEIGAPGPAADTASGRASYRSRLTLALATALLDDGQPADAEAALNGLAGPRGAGWHLRAGLAAAALRRYDEARTELAATRAGDLGPEDRPWHLFLQGMLAGASGDTIRAGDYYQQAERAAGTDLVRARFILAYEEARLRLGPASADTIEQIHQNEERFEGTATGYDFARSYAVMLAGAGRKTEAIAALQRQLIALPSEEHARADDFHLLLGLIAGGDDAVGRNALTLLLENGADPDRQRVALQILANASRRGAARVAFRAELDRLVALAPPHPILEDLLLFRATWALEDKDYLEADQDARELLERFPGSPLKAHALGVLAGLAWEEHRYRTVADEAAQAREELPQGEARRELGVLVAEAWYRAGDFRSAADAYAAALRSPPGNVQPGNLMFQRVEAEIRAGSPSAAEPVLDDLARDPAFDPVNRWQAEWNLARALQLDGRTREAFARVNRLLGSPAGDTQAARALPAELRARMAWLQARLSYDAGEPARTLELAASLEDSLADLPAALQTEIASLAELLEAQANLSLNRDSAALDILKRLRRAYPRSDAALYSYIVEADHDAQRDRVVQAQDLLTRLADIYPDSPYAPFALYQAALQAERLGQEKNLREAYKLIESLVSLVNKYPDTDRRGDLVFYARLKQGDLLRELNQFPQAQQVYESLLNNFSQHEDVVLAMLALAECHNAQSATDQSHVESARILFEHLLYRLDAPVDVRVEAGFNLGLLDERRNNPDQALAVWWRDVVTVFLLDPANAADLGPKGRYWMARTLLEYGKLNETQGRLDQARDAWKLILTARLPGAALARARLGRYDPREAKP